jgi:hypothetical protein
MQLIRFDQTKYAAAAILASLAFVIGMIGFAWYISLH